MLFHLRVKNLALIDSAEVEFKKGLNILTGETGAGKSILIGSVNIALGGKASKNLIRQGCDSAYVELVFLITDEEKRKELEIRDVFPDEDGLLIISKKIMPTRSISRINDETVTSGRLREITSLLMDIHGQHEHQSLLYHAKHLEILDEYGKSQMSELKQNIENSFRRYTELKKKLDSMQMDQEQRIREADFYRFEINEIESALLRSGEEEELESAYKKEHNKKKIMKSLSEAYKAVDTDLVSKAIKLVEEAAEYDDELSKIRDQLYDIDTLLNESSRDISDYMDHAIFDEENFYQIEERLNMIRSLEQKYGKTIEAVLKNLEEKKEKLEELEHYQILKEQTKKELGKEEKILQEFSERLSKVRQNTAEDLTGKIEEGLKELNFLDVTFRMEFRRLSHFTENGFDEVEFMISTNPGEPVRSLGLVASGGELSRIMLAIKTVLAETDQIPTLIFDEIDTGISGRTAQKVSEKLRVIAKKHQVLCITHLPQIAAMADSHYEIKKMIEDGRTKTVIHALERAEMIKELARLLGGAEITDTVLKSAEEMKKLAEQYIE